MKLSWTKTIRLMVAGGLSLSALTCNYCFIGVSSSGQWKRERVCVEQCVREEKEERER